MTTRQASPSPSHAKEKSLKTVPKNKSKNTQLVSDAHAHQDSQQHNQVPHSDGVASPVAQPHVYVYSPSGAVRDKAAFRRGIARLKAQGYAVEIDKDALASHTRFAGDDATRLAAIGRAAASGADIALISRGGYGITRLLPQMPWKAMAKSVDRGMQWVGLSDFTALQLGALAQKDMLTWAGPDVVADWGAQSSQTVRAPAQSALKVQPDADEGADEIMAACFDDLAYGQGEGAGWRMRATPRQPLPPEIYIKKATLWGGNLSVLTSLLGTPYFPKVRGGILFIEDINEHPYRVERMLTQLLHAGVLGKQKAIVLGQFTQFKLTPHDKGFDMTTVVQWLRSHIKVPVVTHLPFGHVATKVVLPVGCPVSLSVEGADALLYWGHR